MSSAISPIAMVTSSGMASRGPELVFGMFFSYLLVTVVPFLVVSWRMPNTYPTGGVRRGTATQAPRDPGQPPSPSCRTPPGQSAGTRQPHPGNNLKPRFRCHVVNHLDTSTAIHSRSPSWSPPDASPAPSPHRSPPRPHDQRSMRRFEASPRRATPKGQTFIGCTAPPSPTITHSSRPPAFVAHQVLIIARFPSTTTAVEGWPAARLWCSRTAGRRTPPSWLPRRCRDCVGWPFGSSGSTRARRPRASRRSWAGWPPPCLIVMRSSAGTVSRRSRR